MGTSSSQADREALATDWPQTDQAPTGPCLNPSKNRGNHLLECAE